MLLTETSLRSPVCISPKRTGQTLATDTTADFQPPHLWALFSVVEPRSAVRLARAPSANPSQGCEAPAGGLCPTLTAPSPWPAESSSLPTWERRPCVPGQLWETLVDAVKTTAVRSTQCLPAGDAGRIVPLSASPARCCQVSTKDEHAACTWRKIKEDGFHSVGAGASRGMCTPRDAAPQGAAGDAGLHRAWLPGEPSPWGAGVKSHRGNGPQEFCHAC